MESHIKYVGEIINDIHLLFVEVTTSYIVETDSDNNDSDSIDLDMWDIIYRYTMRSQH